MRSLSEPAAADQLRFDNRFRLVVSLSACGSGGLLKTIGFINVLRPFLCIFAFYSIPYVISWLWIARHNSGPQVLRYGLGLIDLAAITAAVRITGGPQSPFFYLYPIPFLVHALQFDLRLILWDGAWSTTCYSAILWNMRHQLSDHNMDIGVGQLAFLGVIILAALWTARRFQRKDDSVNKSLNALQTMVMFLEALNAMPPALSDEELQINIVAELRKVLTAFHVHPRLWIANTEWKN